MIGPTKVIKKYKTRIAVMIEIYPLYMYEYIAEIIKSAVRT